MYQTGLENLTYAEREIKQGLIQNQAYVKAHKGFASNEIAFLSELFVEELLNVIYLDRGWHFQNLNLEKANYPAIDLADRKNRVCFQVTITNSSTGINQKIKETLQSFFDREMRKDFDQLFIFIASGIESPQKIKTDIQLTVNGRTVDIPETLFSSRNVLDFSSLYNVIFNGHGVENLDRIKNVLFKIPKRPQKESYSFAPTHTYIRRRITNVHGQEIQLEEKLEKEKRVTLLGVGGLGKTTEVNFWANLLSNKLDIFCFNVKLIDYSTSLESLLDARCKNWQNVPENCKTYFLLDGFDEVDSNKMIEAANEIRNFACKYPDFRILVSCRKNFNPFDIVESESQEKDKFFTCFLDEINEYEIDAFISQECSDPEHFKNEIKRGNFLEILKNPYYLGNAIDIFNSQGIIPKSKADFFQQLIDLRVDFQKSKYPLAFRSFDDFELKESLKSLALTMQYAGTYKIADTDFNQVIRKPETRDIIERVFFNKEDNDWRFEHNNFQEFLAAQKVSEMEWTEIKNIILLNNRKLKPKWLNAFSFLVSLSENNKELVNYFLGNDIESLIKVEPQKLEKEVRDQIFIKIFNRHKKEETVIWRNAYNETDLFNFGELEANTKLMEFLLTELDTKELSPESMSNALHILSHLSINNSYRHKIKPLYMRLLDRSDIHKYESSYVIISSFSKWQFFDVETKDILISNPSLFANDAPLSTLCHYIADGKFLDLNAELVHKFIGTFKTSRYVSGEYSLLEIIPLLSHIELTALIVLEMSDADDYEEGWKKDLYNLINKRAIEIFHSGSQITQAIIEFIYASFYYNDAGYGNCFKTFFEKTGLVESSFKSCFLDDVAKKARNRKEFFIVPALIANKECLDWVIDLYSKNEVTDDNIWYFLAVLAEVGNSEGRAYFEAKINKLTYNKFTTQPHPMAVFNKLKGELWLNALLDQQTAICFVNKAFQQIGKHSFTKKEELRFWNTKEERYKDVEFSVGLDFIRRYPNEKVKKDHFIEWFSDQENWERIVLNEYKKLGYGKLLPEKNLLWIKNWCEKNQDSVVLNEAIELKADGEYSYLTKTYDFIYFVIFLNLKLPQSKLEEMIPLIGLCRHYKTVNGISKEVKLSDYLKENLPLDLFKERIISNIKRGFLVEDILYEHIKVIEKEKWTEALPFLPQYIIDKKVPKYFKSNILNFYRIHTGDGKLLIPALQILDLKSEENSFEWSLLEFMAQERNSEAITFLKTQLNVENINRFKLAVYLMVAGEEQGFAVLLEVLKENHILLDWELLRKILGNLQVAVFEKYFISAFLLNLLEKYIALKIDSSGFGDLLPVIFNKFFDLVSLTSIDDVILIAEIDKVLDFSEKNRTQKNARYHYNEFIEKVNLHKDKSFRIADSLKELRKIGVCFEIG